MRQQAYMPKAKSDIHITPDRVFNEALKLGYDLRKAFDPCPLNPTFDGLTIRWEKFNYINPPYSDQQIEKWVSKAFFDFLIFQNESVLLLPVKTDQEWFHKYCSDFYIHFFKGRLKFKGEKHHATQPHMLVFMVKMK